MDDLISRQAAIDALKKNTFRLTFAEEQNCEGHVAWSAEAVYSDVMEGALLELPSAQPEQRWIPCGERLPEDNSDILVTYVEKDEKRIAPVNYGCGTWFDCLFDNVLDQVGVLAWMPLPEPYEAESEDKE